MADDYTGYDDMGDDYAGADDLGAAAPRQMVRRGPQQAMRPQLQAAARPPMKLRGYIGMGSVVFNAANGSTGVMTVEPQRSFRPERLVIDRFDGSAVTGPISCRVNNIFIGDQPQSPSVEQPAPISMFRPDATVSGVDFNKAIPGQKIRIELSASSAPAGTEFIRLEAGFYGDMLR